MNFSELVIFLTFWNFVFAEMNPALFLDWEEEKLVEVSEYNPEAICKFCISACPVASNSFSEKLLNDNISVTKTESIFLRKVYKKDTPAKDMEMKICKNSFTPALAWNYQTHMHDVGYELYYQKEKIESKVSEYDSYIFQEIDGKISSEWTRLPDGDIKIERTGEHTISFKTVTDPEKNLVIDNELSSQKTELSDKNSVILSKKGENIDFEIAAESGSKWKFHWIGVLSFEISDDLVHRYVKFKADKSNDHFHKIRTTENNCKTYFIGDGEIIENNKNGSDEDVGIQEFDPISRMEEKTKKSNDRLVKTQIIPMDMFHTVAARLATCVYLNFAFIWETIANGILKKIDLFVHSIHQESHPKMEIFFGVYDILQGYDPAAQSEIVSENKLFLNFPIPGILFRLITIRGMDRQFYGVAIVIHNRLKPVKDTDRICSPKDEIEGWNEIKNTNSATGFSYTCPQTEEVLIKLGFNQVFPGTSMKPLKLNHFPLIQKKTLTV